MERKTKRADEPVELERIKDIQPPPEDLVLREDTVKVTLSLDRSTVEFFKAQARRRRAPYQRMIRRLLGLYASHHERETHA